MPIISISRGSFTRGKEVAEQVATRLGYRCISRDTILESSDEFAIPEIRLVRNIRHATQILERFSHGRQRYSAFMASAILNGIRNDNCVYHGLAGEYFFKEISHVIKVRIIADLDLRAQGEALRAGISKDEARQRLKTDDDERRKWSMFLYGIDIEDPGRYDMVLKIGAMGVPEAVEMIARAAGLTCFQSTPESIKKVGILALEAEVKAALFDFPSASVSTGDDGTVYLNIKAPQEQEAEIRIRVEEAVRGIEGMRRLELRVDPYY
jgi:cytidylate kinase